MDGPSIWQGGSSARDTIEETALIGEAAPVLASSAAPLAPELKGHRLIDDGIVAAASGHWF
jgi:hypothetical protein